MKLSNVFEVFRRETVPPTEFQGDPWGTDATTEDIARLLNANPADLRAEDFSGYLGFCTSGGDDDLRFLFPPILRIWESELYRRDSWFTQYFHEEICRTNFIERALNEPLRRVTTGFMIRALADRIASEESLRIAGRTTTQDWFAFFASFGVFSSSIEVLWDELWRASRPGHAIAMLQFFSCILYDDDNPVFAPWSCDQGGGPPHLWEYDSVGFGEHWKQENLAFLSSALTATGIRERLVGLSRDGADPAIRELASRFLARAEESMSRIDQRCADLIGALSVPSGPGVVTWESLREIRTERGS